MTDWPSGTLGSGRAEHEGVGRERKPGDPAGRVPHGRTAGQRRGERRTVVIEPSAQRRREIAGGLGFEAGDDAAPLAPGTSGIVTSPMHR